jgi:hypothetical protein
MRSIDARAVLVALALACGCSSADPKWDPNLPATSTVYQLRRGLRPARGPIHLHSPYSHDACDKMGDVAGQLNQTCLGELRDGLCRTHQDYAMLTDHADFFAATEWDATFLPGPGDEVVMEGGQHVGSRLACPDGSKVLLMVGSENALMPLGLREHVAATADERKTILDGTDAATAQIFRDHGALVAVAHGESHDVSQLMAVQPSVLEIYNLHANLGPDIRAMMGLDPLAPINALLPFITMEDRTLVPDMAMLLFWEENGWELDRLNAMWGAGRQVMATLGVDAHENVVSGHLSDDERGDSYRRVLRWFSNHLLVPEVSSEAIRDAIAHGRGYGVFEIFGQPTGFDFRAESAGAVAEIGDTVMLALAPRLVLAPPDVPGVSARDLRLRLLRIDASGSNEVAAGPATQPLSWAPTAPGAYRAEVRITPRHLRSFLGSLAATADQELVWIYTSPIYVQ